MVYSMINKNMQIVSRKLAAEKQSEVKPLVVMFPWLLARKNHISKYYDIYLSRGYDVLSVSITPWQFFWPLTGTQVFLVTLKIKKSLGINV